MPATESVPSVQEPAVAEATVQAENAAPVESGVFVPTPGRLVDTRDGTGGVTGPVPANTWVPIQALGRLGIPAKGAKAVVLTVTSVNAPADNWTQLASNTDRPTTQTTNLFSGANEIFSNTSIVPIGTDGQIALRTSVAQNYVIEVQGYFTDGAVMAPGGYVPVKSSRVVDTRDGTGTPKGQWVNDQTYTVNLKNVGGVPNTAGAVFANVILVSRDPANPTPTLYPFPAGGTDPEAPLHYRGGVTTGVGTTLDMNAAGEVSFRVGYSPSPVDIVIDVEGYFDGQASDSTFTSLATRLYDSRTDGAKTPIPAGGSLEVQVAGVDGLPAAGSELAGVTMNVAALNDPAAATTGFFRVYPSDEPEPSLSQVNYHLGGDIVSNVIVVRPGAVDGKVIVKNVSASPAHVTIDSQGWFTNAHLLAPASGNNGAASGERAAASMVGRSLNDAIKSSWNPTNGNTVLTGKLMSLTGVGQDTNISWRYNSVNDARPTLNVGRVETSLRVDTTTDNVTYTAPDGGWYTFKTKSPGVWAMPPGMNASLTQPNAKEYRIRFNDTGITNIYTDDGANYSLARSIDANKNTPNTITYNYVNGVLDTTKDTQGRTVKYVYANTKNPNQPTKITDQSLNRSINLEYNAGSGRLSKITDATGAATVLAYNSAGKLTAVTDARQAKTSYEYDASKRVSKITYATGTPVQSIYTPAYVNATTTTLTDPNNKVATYTYNGSRQVTSVKDPNGNNAAGTFDGHDNRTASTDGLGNTTTAQYNTNNSLTKVTSPAGATGGTGGDRSFTYNATPGDPLSNYQPADSTDSEGQITEISYDANTNAPNKTVSGGDDPMVRAVVSNFYQGDVAGTSCGAKQGSLCRTTDGNGNATTYTYDAQGNVASILRPAPLGAIVNTYDAAGRVATSKDGKNQTATYTYDANDRIQQVRYASTCIPATCVTYTYDGNGNLTKRVDASGTTTYAYDQQNRSSSKTVGTTTTSLTYDGASNILSFVDPTGTIGYRYDAANRLTALAEPGGSCPATPAFPNTTKCVGFGYDKSNRRTTTTYPNGVKNTTVFDNAGRVAETRANTSAGAVLTSRAYTYSLGDTGKDGSLQATVKTEANALTTYGYDTHNRLTAATLGAVSESWVYDKNGNRTSATKTGKPTLTSVYNAADQLCWTAASTGACASAPAGATTYTYDTNGNTTKAGTNTSGYNTLDQFTSATFSGTTTSFAYAGLRNDERTTSGNTSFLNGSLGVTTQTTNGATTSFIRDPDGKLISMRNSAGASFYYTTDALGSVILLSDASQAKAATYSYDAWGNTTQSGAQAGNNPYQYVSGYRDSATGYTKFGARYYNPAIGRFTQLDPSGQNPHYSYAGNNSITNSDPSGLAFFEISVEGCFYLCVSVGYAEDDNGDSAVTGGLGVGNPGVSGGGQFGGGDVSTGISPEINCGSGFASGSVSPDGVTAGLGTGYSTPMCSVGVGGSLKL